MGNNRGLICMHIINGPDDISAGHIDCFYSPPLISGVEHGLIVGKGTAIQITAANISIPALRSIIAVKCIDHISSGGKKLILLNQNIKSSTRISFTLAHELGHYFIPHHMEPLYACNVNELISSADLNSREEEREADIFASELLLPNQLMANSAVDGFEDILNVAREYSTSIPATAIRMIEHSNDNVCFVCCKNMKIEWFIASSIFTEYLTLKDIIGSHPQVHDPHPWVDKL